MHATAAGLLVAIPVMVFYSFLHTKQTKLFNEIDQHSNKLIELLRSRDFKHFGVVYPVGSSTDKMSKTKSAQIKTV